MISFKRFCEATNSTAGNYVSIDAKDPNGFMLPARLRPKTGTEVKLADRHVTLVYSEKSNLDPVKLLKVIEDKFPKKIQAEIIGFDCFDALPKNGTRDVKKSTLVMKLKSPVLDKIHERLVELGCQHSYDKFSAHVSLYYDVEINECHQLKKTLERKTHLPMQIELSGYKSEPIDDDWENKLD